MATQKNSRTSERRAPLEMNPEAFRRAGHRLIDQVADFLDSLPQRPVTAGNPPSVIRKRLGQMPLPRQGADPQELLAETAELLFENSLFNGHPRFLGYITSSAAPIGALADLLAATVNPNVGAWTLSPMATEIEWQTIRWIAEMVGYPRECGGVLVSGGNMANFVGFLTAMHHMNIREKPTTSAGQPRIYASQQTHTWLQKAVEISGLPQDSVRSIATDSHFRMRTAALRQAIEADFRAGDRPFLVIGTAGSVSSGAIDPLPEIAALCREFNLWFHIDGAYGAFAAALPDAPPELQALHSGDSLALDPHKWLYAPLEAGCALVKEAQHLRNTFSFHPPYYKFDEVRGEAVESLVDYGPQNSRGFRALKVWLGLRQAGLEGYRQMISDDIALARYLFELAAAEGELEAISHSLSITTFRYVPPNLALEGEPREEYLNRLNTALLTRLQEEGEAFVSNALLGGKYLLRACVVNFRTTRADIETLIQAVLRLGRELQQRGLPA